MPLGVFFGGTTQLVIKDHLFFVFSVVLSAYLGDLDLWSTSRKILFQNPIDLSFGLIWLCISGYSSLLQPYNFHPHTVHRTVKGTYHFHVLAIHSIQLKKGYDVSLKKNGMMPPLQHVNNLYYLELCSPSLRYHIDVTWCDVVIRA